ncbi:hypothetical protein, partial [Phytobacter diazotrophicus]|uniref:hypothetical protein n=1 Tax=Phytobacter diazotrophicus TaxID=395631 RepID=UPI002935D760
SVTLYWGINMESVYFSPSLLSFIPAKWKDEGTYTTETWPADAVLLTDEVAQAFWKQTPPGGKQLGVVDDGPAWVDIPQPSNSDLLKLALQSLVTQYQLDIEALNRAWLAAAVNDGASEGAKKSAVVSQIAARKAQYASDRAAVIAQYPV